MNIATGSLNCKREICGDVVEKLPVLEERGRVVPLSIIIRLILCSTNFHVFETRAEMLVVALTKRNPISKF